MIRIAMAFILVFNIYNVFSQVAIYLDSNHDEVLKSDNYTRFKIVFKQNNDTIERIYSKEGKLSTENAYSSYFKKERNGLSQEWHENGTIKSQINFKKGSLNGSLNTFWDNGKTKRLDTYKNGELKNGKCYDSTGLEIPHFE